MVVNGRGGWERNRKVGSIYDMCRTAPEIVDD